MKCPKCSRRRVIRYAIKGEHRVKCRKCRHTWKEIHVKVEPEEQKQ